jgi:hypothetical protein
MDVWKGCGLLITALFFRVRLDVERDRVSGNGVLLQLEVLLVLGYPGCLDHALSLVLGDLNPPSILVFFGVSLKCLLIGLVSIDFNP